MSLIILLFFNFIIFKFVLVHLFKTKAYRNYNIQYKIKRISHLITKIKVNYLLYLYMNVHIPSRQKFGKTQENATICAKFSL
jgi:hypothetical protein